MAPRPSNRLAREKSPYLLQHAFNPVDWFPWGQEAFDKAKREDKPIFLSVGYSTCHWCHVMARESFSDPAIAAYLNANFVSIKVDREEHPDVDSSYLAAASAFTDQLGWPLTVFATPNGRAFYAGTYFPPVAMQGLPSFREVLEAMVDAWQNQRDNVEDTAGRLAAALTGPRDRAGETDDVALPGEAELDGVVGELLDYEDTQYGGFGGAPKFPVAPVVEFLQDRGLVDERAAALAQRMTAAMAASPLRDAADGGFFRYATKRDWSEPHYERMLYDNAQLLRIYARSDADVARGIASFLLETLRLPSGGFASAQDSESTVDGQRVEGGYYALDADARSRQTPPGLDEKILTGWNGLAIGALASAGARLGELSWIDAAITAADLVATGDLVRARIGDRVSPARPTLEDFGMLADGLIDLAVATGDVRFAVRARELVTTCVVDGGFAVPGGADPVLAANGLVIEYDPSEGAYPSGLSSISRAAIRLDQLGWSGLREAAVEVLERVTPLALESPISFGSALDAMSLLERPLRQLVVVAEARTGELVELTRGWSDGLAIVVTADQSHAFADEGFSLFDARVRQGDRDTAYLCENFVCQLPVFDRPALARLLGDARDR